MRKTAVLLAISLLLQLVPPIPASAENLYPEPALASDQDATEIEGLIQEKYYKSDDGYHFFIGATMSEWDDDTTQITDVAYQLDNGEMTELGTVSSERFSFAGLYDKTGGCLTLSLADRPSQAGEGSHSLAVYFTVGTSRYKVAGTTELVDESLSEGVVKRWSDNPVEYISSKAGTSIQMVYAIAYTLNQDEKWSGKWKLVHPGETEAVLSSELSYVSTSLSMYDGRYRKSYRGKDDYYYNLDSKLCGEYRMSAHCGDIILSSDLPEGYYDVVVVSSTGKTYRQKNAYYSSSKPIIFDVRKRYVSDWSKEEDEDVFFSDDTADYVSVFVYGLNLTRDNIPIFYDTDDQNVLASYVEDDPACGWEKGNRWGDFFRLKKSNADLGVTQNLNGHVKVTGDVIYASGDDYCELNMSNRPGIFFVEYLEHGQLYEESPGKLRLYIGEGIKCEAGDSVNYKYMIGKEYTCSEKATVQRNDNGKYIEFDEKSEIYTLFSKRYGFAYEFELTKGNTILTKYSADISMPIEPAEELLVPAGCSWEVHAVGEIVKTIYSGRNESAATVSVLNGSQISNLAQMGTVRVCIYDPDGTVRERGLKCFLSATDINLPITVDTLTDPMIKVVDYRGNPISGAEVSYKGKVFTTSDKGIVTLTDYEIGNTLEISKQNYITKTVNPFVRDSSGCNTYVLMNVGGTIENAYMILNGSRTDLLTKEATINTYYKTTTFSIKCVANGIYDTYELYSGDEMIARNSDGNFSDLIFQSFKIGEPVYLCVNGGQAQSAKVKLGIQVIYLDPKVYELSIGDEMSVSVPDGIPIIGGKKLDIDLGTLPVQTKVSGDNKLQIGINAAELCKKDKDWFSTLKKLNKDNFAKYLSDAYSETQDPDAKSEKIKPKFKVMGYLEGPLTSNNYLKGKLLIEFSVKYKNEKQHFFPVISFPYVIETSISGKINADGSITFTSEEGMTGGKLSVGGEIGLGLYGGAGLANIASAGVYGEAALGLKYDIFPELIRGLNELYVKGNAGVKAKVFGHEYKHAFVDGTYYIIKNDTGDASNYGVQGFTIDNDKVYDELRRDYLDSNGTMVPWNADGETHLDGSIDETVLQSATYLDIIPQVVRVGDTAMLFYLSDAGMIRETADRSMLVYSVWDKAKENWSEPVPVADDGTADFLPDVYTDGTKVYAVWQNAQETLASDLTLNDIAERLTLHAAVYDAKQNKFTDLGDIESENGLLQQWPQIVASGNRVSVYWYENEQDNVLGMTGTNKIYQAVIEDADSVSVSSIMSVPTEDVTDTEDEEQETGDVSEDSGDIEQTDSETDDTAESEDDDNSDDSDVDTSETEKEGTEEKETGEEESGQEESAIDGAGMQSDVGESVSNNGFSKYVALGEEETTKEDESDTESEDVADDDNDQGNEGETEQDNTDDNISDDDAVDPNETTADDVEEEGEEEREEKEEEEEEEEEEEDVTDSEEQEEEIVELPEQASAASINVSAWNITALQNEAECIISADAGKMNGKTAYTYVAGKLDSQYSVMNSSVVLLNDGEEKTVLETGALEKTEFTSIFAGETVAWYSDGDIHYLDGNGDVASLFGADRLPSSSYTLLSDDGSPEVIFPVNMDGKSDLYRIGYADGEFLEALPITEQDDYVQYVDGFIDGSRTILVYNSMEVDDDLEEVKNSLCTGTLDHDYYDMAVQSAGSMIRYNEETGEETLEITAQIFNNGTLGTGQLNISLSRQDGSVLETETVDTVLAPGETGYASAGFSLDHITEAGEYLVTVSGAGEKNTNNNSVPIDLGEALLQVNAGVTAVGDTRTVQIGIENTGVKTCGGTVSVQDAETGEVYCSSDFDPIARGQITYAEIPIDPYIFTRKDVLTLEAVVVPNGEQQGSVSDFMTVYAPVYTVDFVTETDKQTVFVNYGKGTAFPDNPTKEGAYFIGWYTSENPSEGMLYTEETPITESVTLYACFAEEQSSIPISNCSVSAIPTQYYSGKALKPSVTVKYGSKVLSPRTDYSVSYRNNKEQGNAVVTVTGKGKYSGSTERTFTILYPLSKVSVKAIPSVEFTGEWYTPDVVVTYNKKTLIKGKDYTVTYTNNRNAGTAGVTLTGKGAYGGSKVVTFNIKGLSITKNIVFEKPKDVVYTGGKLTPAITVKTKEGKQLQAGSDYKIVYENAVNKGTATATVIGNGNFTGTKKLSYKILAKPLTDDMIEQIMPQTYTGSAIRPEVVIIDKSISAEPLVNGKDYTISYSKNKAAGTATVTVKGKGNYTGTVKTSFEISKVNLTDNPQISIKVNDAAYTGKALKPSVQVYEGAKKLPGSAYTVSYANNVEKGIGTVTVVGKGNYTGTLSADFRIVDKAKMISSLKIAKIGQEVYSGDAIEPEIKITDGAYQLVKGQDYETSYSNQYNVGKATVTVRGIGIYAGSKNISYKITKRSIAEKNVLEKGFVIDPPADLKYTGYALKPDIAMQDNGIVLTLGKDYKLSYKNNTKISSGTNKARITVVGIGNYSGSINTIEFNIVSWDYNNLKAEIPDQIYTGKALKPQVVFYTDGEEIALKSGTAVKIAYANNKNAGRATAIITGKGELKDIEPIKVTFTINRADLEDAVVGKIANQTLKGIPVKPVPKVKVGKNTLKAGRDFTVSYLRNGVKGEAEVIINGIGNYIGQCRKSFIVQ